MKTSEGCIAVGAVLTLAGLLLLMPSIARAQGVDPARVTAGGGMPNFDARVGKEGHAVRQALGLDAVDHQRKADIQNAVSAAHKALKSSIPDLVVEWHPVLGAAHLLSRRGGALTSRAPGADPEQVVRAFLNANAGLFGLAASDVGNLVATANYANPAGNLSWVVLEQHLNGIPVFRGELRAAVTPDGAIASIVSELAPAPDPYLSTAPTMTPEQAIQVAAKNIGVQLHATPSLLARSSDGLTHTFERGPFAREITVELIIFPLAPAKSVLAWRVLLWQDVAAYYVVVDDATGQVLFRKNITNDQTQTATFEVYASDSPGPLSPSNATPDSGIQGPTVYRAQFTFVSELPAFDNLGWIPDGSCETTGNNVDAGLDLVSPDGIDPTGRATGSTGGPSPTCRNFIFSYNPPPGGTDAPTGINSRMGAVTNLFFWSNRYHDRLYTFGFTEAARNFQNDNFGRGGVAGDPVSAQAQDFSGMNNANFSTPADGTPGRMQMYIFTGPNPDRDGSLDQEIVLHELTHGLSNRLIGNSFGLNFSQGRGMGEGWSDFYALSLLSQPTDNPNGVYAAGAYATYRFITVPSFTDNYFYGIRRFPYTTNMSLNPLTFADIDPNQINISNGTYPPSPIPSTAANEVHNVGEVWASMLWEARANLIARLGAAAGNDRMLQIVTDGMKLTPANPTFVQARNAILQAACAGFGGTHELDLWRGFAKRGLGFSAVAPAMSSTNLPGVVEAFDLPLVAGTAVINDTVGGNGNGSIDPGETIGLDIPATNIFTCLGLTNVTGTLTTSTPGVTITQGSSNYGNIAAGTSEASTLFQLLVASSVLCGSQINMTLSFTSTEGVTQTRTITLRVGELVVGTPTTYTYTGPAVSIPDNNPGGAAATITVPGSLVVGDINLNLTNITHTFIGDLVVQLIAPDGTTITMINRLPNGLGTNGNNNFTNTILDDTGVDVIPIQSQAGPVTNGTFTPANPLYGFNGKAGHGTWTLKIIDDALFDVGTVTAWSITIRPATYTCVIGPAMSVTPSSQNFGTVAVGSSADRTFTVQNTGFGTLTGSAATAAPFSIASGGSFSLAAGASQGVTVRFSPTAAGTFAVSVNFTSNSGNFAATVTGTAGNPVTLTLTIRGSATGTVTSNPAGITNCATTCAATFPSGAPINLMAAPGPGASFKAWGGACTGPGACTVTLTAAATVTATFSKVYTDDPLAVGVTPIKAAHITDLRTAIDTLRGRLDLPPSPYTDGTLTPGTTTVRAVHPTDLRTSLNQAYQAAGRPLPTYSDPTIAPGQIIKAIDFTELRNAVRALE